MAEKEVKSIEVKSSELIKPIQEPKEYENPDDDASLTPILLNDREFDILAKLIIATVQELSHSQRIPIREAREISNISIERAAQCLGIGCKGIRRIECGKRGLTISEAKKLCELYKFPFYRIDW